MFCLHASFNLFFKCYMVYGETQWKELRWAKVTQIFICSVWPGNMHHQIGKCFCEIMTRKCVEKVLWISEKELVVYGAMSKIGLNCEYSCYTLILLTILHLQTLPYQNRVVGIFSPCRYGCHFEFKMADLYIGMEKSTYSNQVEKHVILFVWS